MIIPRVISFAAILLIAVIFIPACGNLEYRLNEERAGSTIMNIREAETKFKESSGKYGSLAELISAGLIDASLANGVKYGYKYEIRVKGKGYGAIAVPEKYGETGSWSFYVDETGVIRGAVRDGAEANTKDQPVRYQQ